ncbi:hypothetical protein, partial [Gimesia aquarii]|uniref:hypothetical protein n=1 Tax=Gimesia aquarii TaxID=2527964 RepID=UPI001E3DF76F
MRSGIHNVTAFYFHIHTKRLQSTKKAPSNRSLRGLTFFSVRRLVQQRIVAINNRTEEVIHV